MKNQQGFTLIELMIVVAIIAILAAIALPAYQDFLKRSKVSEAVVAAGACKTSVADYVASNNAFPLNLDASGCATQVTQYVSGTDVTNGIITVTSTVPGALGTITLTPTATAANLTEGVIPTWTCNGSILAKFKPANCR